MTAAGLLLALGSALFASAQGPVPEAASPAPPAAPGVAPGATSLMVVPGGEAPPAPPETPPPEKKKLAPRKSHVRIDTDAAEWVPVSVVAAKESDEIKPAFALKCLPTKEPFSSKGGEASRFKTAARAYKVKDNDVLIVSVYPVSLRLRRTHLEVHYVANGGILEKARISAVRIVGGSAAPQDEDLDSFGMRAKGVVFEEEGPESAQVVVKRLDVKPGKDALNEANVKLAVFGDRHLGAVRFAYSLLGVSAGSRLPR